eukprot:6326779-Pyramimonas_sp.AAC.2
MAKTICCGMDEKGFLSWKPGCRQAVSYRDLTRVVAELGSSRLPIDMRWYCVSVSAIACVDLGWRNRQPPLGAIGD